MLDATELLVWHPHQAFRVLTPYSVSYTNADEHISREVVIEVRDRELLLARANFSGQEELAWCQNVTVNSSYRRRGIATALYVLAEVIYGQPLYNFWPDEQTEAARGLWSQADRPFGSR